MLLTSSSLILYLFDSCKISFSCFSLAEVLKGCHLHVLRCNSFGLEKTGSQMDQKKKDLERSFFVADGSYMCLILIYYNIHSQNI